MFIFNHPITTNVRENYAEHNNRKRKITTQQMALVAIMTALTCILAPFSLPIGPVPISYQSGYLLLIVFTGLEAWNVKLRHLPSDWTGWCTGIFRIYRRTGETLVNRWIFNQFIPMAIIAGIVIDKYTEKWLLCLLAMIVGTIVCYALGTALACL